MIQGNTYKERCEYQVQEWAKGNPIHNTVDDECCPDFSCCNKKMDTPMEIRQAYLNGSEDQRESLCFSFLGAALAGAGHEVHVANGKDEINSQLN